MNRLRSFLNLDRGEEVPTFLLFLYLALALTSFVITKAIRDSLFLFRFSAADLPYMYIAVAVLSGFAVSIYVRLSAFIRQTVLISGTQIFFIGSVVLLWRIERLQWPPMAWVFWIWSSIFGIIMVTQVWTVANSVLDLRQAKRLFPLISSGGILGAVAGGMVAATLVKVVGTDNLVMALIPFLVLCWVIVRVIMRNYLLLARPGQSESPRAEGKKDVAGLWKTMKSSRYLQLIAAASMLSLIVTLIIDNQFKLVVQQSFRSKDQLTHFFGSFTAYLSLFAFLVQVIVGSRIVEKFGVRVTLLMLPLAVLAGTGVVVAYPLMLRAGILLRGSDQTLRYSVDRASSELLYLPLPQSAKAQVKAFIDMVVSRLADGLGGILLLVLTRVFRLRLTGGVALFDMALISLWIWVVFQMRKEYVSTIRASLSERPALPKATLKMIFSDIKSVGSLRSMLESNDEEVVLYALELALAMRRTDLIPRKLLAHPSPKVRAKALEALPLAEPEILERARADNDSSVRVKFVALAGNMARPGNPMSAISGYLQMPDVRLRLAALTYLSQHSEGKESARIKEHLTSLVAGLEETSEEWKDVAEALGEIEYPGVAELHLHLLSHPNPEVKKQAILSAGRAGRREVVPFLVQMLEERECASDVRRSLQAYGSRILGTLRDVVLDPLVTTEVRRNVPLVLAQIVDQGSVDLLLDILFDYDGLVRYRAIRALGKLRLLDPSLRFDAHKVVERIREECETTLWLQRCAAALYPTTDSSDLLAQLLKERVARGKDRVFRLLALLLPPTTACASFLALVEEDRLRIASAAEYLDNVLPGNLKRWVIPLVESRVGVLREKEDIGKTLAALVSGADAILRDCVADAVGKNRWPRVSGSGPA